MWKRDGELALTNSTRLQFDIVLTDWNMSHMTGIELLKAICGGGSTAPVVLFTTGAEESRIREAIKGGVSDYGVKPFETETLRNKPESYRALGT